MSHRKLTIQDAAEIRYRASLGGSNRTLATEYGVSHFTIRGIVNGWLYAEAPAPRPVAPPPDVDPRIALYRAEKARRADRLNPAMEAAKSEYVKLLEDTKPGKSGRPRGSKSGDRLSLSGLFAGINE